MTNIERAAKDQIIRKLRSQGYATYARLFDLFDLGLTENPEVVGYMIPGEARIVINSDLSINQVSTIVRHEILHEYLNHKIRADKFHQDNPDLPYDHDVFNIAADFEISNRGYTKADKATSRAILLGDKVLKGLVTEDSYPGWEHDSFEQMYKKLIKAREENKKQVQQLLDQLEQISKKELGETSKKAEEEQQKQNQQAKQMGEIADQAEEEKEEASSAKGKADAEEAEKTAKEAEKTAKENSKKLDDIKKKLQDATKSESEEEVDNSKVFKDDAELKRKQALAKRLEEINKLLDDMRTGRQLDSENIHAIRKEQQAASDRDARRAASSPLRQFQLSLNRFIADQLATEEEDSLLAFNPSYEGSGIIMPGKRELENSFRPVVNVYFDASGSFDNPAKTEGARKAIGTIQKYVDDGDLIMNLFFHANSVNKDPNAVGKGNNADAVARHIIETKPTNVIIITDNDLSNWNIPVTVPGAVWMLFYDSESDGMIKNLHGKKETRYYMIDYR